MAAKISFKSTITDNDIRQLADNLRAIDAYEINVIAQLSPFEAIKRSVENSPNHCFSVFVNNQLLAIGGCSKTGNPWLLATPAINRYNKSLTRHAKVFIAQQLKHHPLLINAISANNHATKRWLKHLGFTLSEPFTYNDGLIHVFSQKQI